MIHVQHHPTRASLLPALLAALEPLPVEVITDPHPDGPPSAWRTYRECLVRPVSDPYVVVIQDDAQPAPGFADALESILEAQAGRIVLLFVPGAPCGWERAVMEADRRGDRYTGCNVPRWTPTVATAWPVEQAARFVEWADAHVARLRRFQVGDDNLVGRWASRARPEMVATVPSIVQHPDVQPSLIGRKHRGGRDITRTARVWTGTADYDWTTAR